MVLLLALGGCGGKGASSATSAKVDLDADPFALLPGSALVVGTLDARAMFADGQAGAIFAKMADSLAALPASAGFVASRDVDRATAGVYAANEPEVVVVLSGRFDVGKITAVTQAKSGAAVAWSAYAGFATASASHVMIAPLTSKTLLAGTPNSVHAALDRIKNHTATCAVPAQTIEALKSKGVQLGAVADFASQPIAAASVGSINLSWLKGLRSARATGDFTPPGLNASVTLAYGTPEEAQGAVDGVRAVNRLVTLLAPLLGGIRVENLRAGSSGNEASIQFALSDSSLQALLGLAGHFLTDAAQ